MKRQVTLCVIVEVDEEKAGLLPSYPGAGSGPDADPPVHYLEVVGDLLADRIGHDVEERWAVPFDARLVRSWSVVSDAYADPIDSLV